MRYCKSLNGSLNIERDRVQFCCATKHHMPMLPWNADEELPLEQLGVVRKALIRAMNEDLDQPVAEYVAHGLPGPAPGHPCKGCRQIIETDGAVEAPSSDQLTHYLHLQAYTFCNAQCVFCKLRLDEGRMPLSRGRDLDKALNRAVAQLFAADAIAPSCQIVFSSGEPSLSQDTMNTLSEVTRKGFSVFVNTNAIRYAPEIEEALKAGKALVQVSMDSGDRERYRAVKGVDQFDSVAANIDRYGAAARGGSTFWVKYIVFSQTNSRAAMDSFVDFCIRHRIRNVSVNADYNEGEVTILKGGHPELHLGNADRKSLKAFGYLAARLEISGVCVNKEFAHLTPNEQALAKREYALSVMDLLQHTPEDREQCIRNIVEGLDMAMLPMDDPRLKTHFKTLLAEKVNGSKSVALFGAGRHAQWIQRVMGELGVRPIVAFDNHPPVASTFGFPVVKPAEVSKYGIDAVVIGSTAYHLNIYTQIAAMKDFSRVRIIDPYLNLVG